MSETLSISEADQRLRFWFDGCPAAAVALSGGVDSSLVAWYALACLGADRCTAYIADSPSLKRADLDEAKAFCQQYQIPVQTLATQELSNPNYAENPNNRCYYCKSTLYDDLCATLTQQQRDDWICSGANLDDQGDYRPGMQAASEHQVKHPLLACGINKACIRALAQHHGLPCWDKAASPCLSSRIPYGQSVTLDKLQQIEAAESWLQQQGFDIVRVRHDQNQARIEVPVTEIPKLKALSNQAEQHCRSIGFSSIAIDEEGFVSGKLNRSINS